MNALPIEPRFFPKIAIDVTSSYCWEWRGSLDSGGYGAVNWNGKKQRTHRVMYALVVGKAAHGLSIDHLCRNRKCVRPSHLEAVTNHVNILRGNSIPAINKRKTHCKYGHEFTPENTINRIQGRYCRACNAKHTSEYNKQVKYRLHRRIMAYIFSVRPHPEVVPTVLPDLLAR